jgi:hypothetical protein
MIYTFQNSGNVIAEDNTVKEGSVQSVTTIKNAILLKLGLSVRATVDSSSFQSNEHEIN